MALKVYNTLTRQKEEFSPIDKGLVTFYHCGPTVYWTQHIGNMRGFFCGDFIIRTLKYLGCKVKSARNYTDVGHLTSDENEGEDKIEKTARKEGLAPREIAQKYIRIFEKDAKELNFLEPTYKPKATECINEMIKMIKTLLGKGSAYTTQLAVYFDTSKVKNYSQLSGQKIEEKIKGAGKGDVLDPDKKNPADFALWFFKAGKHKNALQYWPSPFNSSLVSKGSGFPGWHIECSTMAKKYLGGTIDIHMGGIEHIPVHHTNEIAQSESANGVKFVNYWLHNEHLLVNNKKMSKSEGTTYSLSGIKEKGFNSLSLRYLFLQAHYRSKQNFTWGAMESAQRGLNKIRGEIRQLGAKKGRINKEYKEKFTEKISDDFNSPQTLVVLQEVLKSKIKNKDKLATILDFDKVLGLKLEKIKKEKVIIPQEIKKLAQQREKARESKNWQESDRVREVIIKKGFKIKDTKKGPEISPK